MNKSESIKHLATSLNKAQSEMSGAKKTARNPFFKSSYANLEEVIHCIKEPFADNGLSFAQFPISTDGFAGVETIIMHESGEWISNEFMLKVSKNDPQGMGSAITYSRRYALQAAVGCPSEDDDANAATPRPQAKPAAQAQPKPKAKPAAPAKPAPSSKAQQDNITALAEQLNLDDDRLSKSLEWASGGSCSILSQLSQTEAAKLIAELTRQIQKPTN